MGYLKRTSQEVKCLHPMSTRREMCTSSISNVIYHKFSHGAAFCLLIPKNVNFMLKFPLTLWHSERPKLFGVLAFVCEIGLKNFSFTRKFFF